MREKNKVMIMAIRLRSYRKEKDMKKSMEERRLKLWKVRQEAKGYDVSNVKTLKEAEDFFKQTSAEKPETEKAPKKTTKKTKSTEKKEAEEK